MTNLLDLCEKYFGCSDLYEILNIPKTATDKDVRKAYHKLSLQVHPDRVEEVKKLDATEKFKILGKVHSVLSDPEKRRVYDDTGSFDEGECGTDFENVNWSEYWRALFKEITIEDIKNYEKKYKGSEEELKDLKNAYLQKEGDMNHIFEAVPYTHIDEEPRLREIIQKLIDSGEVPAFDAFVNESKAKRERRRRKYEKEAKLVEEIEKKKQKNSENSENDLATAILKRQKDRQEQFTSLFDNLEKKYGGSPKGGKKKPSKKTKK